MRGEGEVDWGGVKESGWRCTANAFASPKKEERKIATINFSFIIFVLISLEGVQCMCLCNNEMVQPLRYMEGGVLWFLRVSLIC